MLLELLGGHCNADYCHRQALRRHRGDGLLRGSLCDGMHPSVSEEQENKYDDESELGKQARQANHKTRRGHRGSKLDKMNEVTKQESRQ